MKVSVLARSMSLVAAMASQEVMAGSPAPRAVPLTVVMEVHVHGSDEVTITDPRGRKYPCRDATCAPIPLCQAVTGFGTLPRGAAGEPVPPQIIFRLYGPSEGRYRIHVAKGGPHITLSVSLSDTSMRCGKVDAIDESPGRSHDWRMSWRQKGTEPHCVVTLVREKTTRRE